jgi:hypothetical protein
MSKQAILLVLTVLLAAGVLTHHAAHAQQNSVSTWDAASFRIWGFIPDWTPQSQIDDFATNGMYTHVSDVIYFGGVRPNSAGNLTTTTHGSLALPKLTAHAAAHGFDLHLCMKAVTGGTEHAVWSALSSSPTSRANFASKVRDKLVEFNMKGFNFDWERPATDDEWANYTQLAKDLRTTINPLGMEVSVDDYGFPDTDWDDSDVFDGDIYDQLFIMGYHYPAYAQFPGDTLHNEEFANRKLQLGVPHEDPAINTAFHDSQLAIGVGTWGTGGPATVALSTFVAAIPNLGYDVTSISGTFNDINGNPRTGTWEIESRQQVREKTQLALSRGMPGMFSWTLHYDATGNLGLHRVMHHYTVFQRGIPDLNLDGQVNSTDAHTLANNMGSVPGWTGTNTAARFDDFYVSGNWEQGDRDGNGFVNQQDANWLASRFTTLGVNIPDRLAYSGTFENFQNSRGLTGRWRAKRETGGNLRETGNYTQHGTSGLTWIGSGVGAAIRSNNSVTIRNQNAAEAFDGLNTAPRVMTVDLATPIDTSKTSETFVTFLVRQNTGSLLSSQTASANRILSLEFLNSSGVNQFDFTFRGQQQQFGIESQADTAGQDVFGSGFAPDATYLFVGKIAGNGANANIMQAALFAGGATVDNFANAGFPWALTAQGSASFNSLITQLQFTSLYEASYSVSNVWIGTAADFFALPSAAAGDFDGDGKVDMSDYLVWKKWKNQSGHQLPADANGNGTIDDGDYDTWRANFGRIIAGSIAESSNEVVPEPSSATLLVFATILAVARAPRHRRCITL